MDNKKKKKSRKKTLIEYGIIAAVFITLYATGLHTEVIGFIQRGFLATGLMTPKIEAIHSNDSGNEITANASSTPADFNLTLMDEDGKTISLAEFRGKVIFLNMWLLGVHPVLPKCPI